MRGVAIHWYSLAFAPLKDIWRTPFLSLHLSFQWVHSLDANPDFLFAVLVNKAVSVGFTPTPTHHYSKLHPVEGSELALPGCTWLERQPGTQRMAQCSEDPCCTMDGWFFLLSLGLFSSYNQKKLLSPQVSRTQNSRYESPVNPYKQITEL